MNYAIIFISAGCWLLSIFSAEYALGSDSGHSGFDFSQLGYFGLFFVGLAIAGIFIRRASAAHLLVAAVTLCVVSFFIRYSVLIAPYEMRVKDMEHGVNYGLPISPQLFLASVACIGLLAHVGLITKNRNEPKNQ